MFGVGWPELTFLVVIVAVVAGVVLMLRGRRR